MNPTMTVSRRRRPIRWPVPSVFMLRTGGLPIEAADELSFPASAAWARAVLDLERQLAEERDGLADALQEAIASHEGDPELRARLIKLRRDVYNLRAPRDGEPARWPADRLGASLHQRLTAWFDAWRRHAARTASGPDIFAAEFTERRAALHRLAEDGDLRRGIVLGSPSLDQYLPVYLKETGARGKRARRAERSLLEYALRTACKTSPFSTLTTVDMGRFAPAGGELLSVCGPIATKRSATRLNLAAIGRLSAIVLADETLRADLPVSVTAGWQVEDGRVRYLRRRLSPGEGDAAVTLDSVHESLFMLPAGSLLTDVLRAVGESPNLRFTDVVTALTGGGSQRPADEVARYLHHLLRLGLLVVPNLQLDIHDPDPVERYAEALRDLDREWADRLAARVGAVNRLVQGYPALPLAGRRETIATIRAELAEAHAELGRADVPVPRTLVYEDSAHRDVTVRADTDRWERDILPGLRAVARLMPIFDINQPRRLATKGFFRARFGVGGHCEDFLRFAHEFQQDFYEHYLNRLMRRRAFDEDNVYVRQENWFGLDEISALDDARAEVAKRVRGGYDRLPAGAKELVLDDAFMDELGAMVPQTLGEMDPRSFFLQLCGGDRPRAVINRVYSGMTLLFSRFAYLFDGSTGAGHAGDLAADLRAELSRIQPPGALLAELKGGYDATNLNLHPAVTPYELVCPGEISHRPAAEQIHMDDLVIEHDAEADRLMLRSRRLDAEVIPVYLGFLMPMALPEVQQVLLNFAYVGMAQLDLWAGTGVALPGRTIARYPRIRYRDVVLQREMWKLHPEYLPQRAAGQSDADWFLTWARWRNENGVPRRVFVTPDGGGGEAGEKEDGGGAARPDHKPLYVDFDSFFCLELLEAMARRASNRLILTEMLPGRDEQLLRDETGTYVSELTVELNGVRVEGNGHD